MCKMHFNTVHTYISKFQVDWAFLDVKLLTFEKLIIKKKSRGDHKSNKCMGHFSFFKLFFFSGDSSIFSMMCFFPSNKLSWKDLKSS